MVKRLVCWTILIGCFLLSSLLLSSCKEGGGSDSSPIPQNTPNEPTDTAWRYNTPAGINVYAERSTTTQYNEHWAVNISNEVSWRWEDIDWITLDEAFAIFKKFYCEDLGWNCKHIEPWQVNVFIKPYAPLSQCNDAETPEQPYEIYEFINGGWNCTDGWFRPSTNTMYFHLGDDPGVDHILIHDDGTQTPYFAFEETALQDELRHFFQAASGRPVGNNDDPVPPIHQIISNMTMGYRIILPGEECPPDVDCLYTE